MEPATLRYQILLAVEQHQASGTSDLLEDKKVAEALAVPVLDVQRQLDILEDAQLVMLAKTFGPSYSVALTPKGRMALEEAASQNPEPTARRIGFHS